jgi:hypothetical protein
MDIVQIGQGGVDRFGLAENRYNWGAFVNAVMKLLVSSECLETI